MARKLLSEGAESELYLEDVYGFDAVVKVRVPKSYRVAELDSEIRRSRTKAEARILHRLRKAGINVPALLAVGRYSIYMERLQGKLLKDTAAKSNTYAQIGELLASMHANDVAHGDFTPANIMLFGGKVFLIDFGLSEITTSTEEKALDLLLIKRSIPRSAYAKVLSSYTKSYANSKAVEHRLRSIELRGRYQTRTLS